MANQSATALLEFVEQAESLLKNCHIRLGVVTPNCMQMAVVEWTLPNGQQAMCWNLTLMQALAQALALNEEFKEPDDTHSELAES